MASRKAGWLTKKGDIVKNLKRRWFILTSVGDLHYFLSEKADTPKGTIETTSITDIVDGPDNTFILKTPSRNWELTADQPEEKLEWMAVIKKEIQRESESAASQPAKAVKPETVQPPKLNQWQMWTPEETGMWVASLGIPEYREAFVTAKVHGSLLQSLSAADLQGRVGITNEEHRWKILGHIQNLVVENLEFGTPMPTGGPLG